MNIYGPGSVYQMNKVSQAVVQFGQAHEASKQETMRQMESITSKQQNMAVEVIDNAVELEGKMNETKGRMIDIMA